jgi:DNA-binding CsgD family transcriptional regulator/PAS domain-containing protein
MRDGERLSRLIGKIYDAALDSTLWLRVLEQAANFVGGPAASLYSRDAASRGASAAYQFGLDPQYVRLYLDKYAKLDPTTAGYFFAQIDEPVDVKDVMPYSEFLESRFYKEWARPQGWVDSANVVLDKSATTAAMFVVFRHQRNGTVDEGTRRRMRLVAPHVRRAVLVSRIIDLKTAEAASFADALDDLRAGIWLVDATGRIVHANVAAYRMIEKADVLRAAGGRLVATDPEADQRLGDLFASAGNGDAAIGNKGVALPLNARDGNRYVAHVLPLTSGARRQMGTAYRAAAAVFVHKAALEIPSPPETIAKAYRLTPTELRVLLAVAEVGGVPEVAEALGIAETTVKSHLGHVYEKVGARRQADLVKLVAGFSNPLLG